jgi:hypothetical protein
MRKRPFIKENSIKLSEVFNNPERRLFRLWCVKIEDFIFVYNKTEVILMYLIYNKGFSRKKILSKLKISQWAYDKFIYQFRHTDEYTILSASYSQLERGFNVKKRR